MESRKHRLRMSYTKKEVERKMLDKYISMEQHKALIADTREFWINTCKRDMDMLKTSYEESLRSWEYSAYISFVSFLIAFGAYIFK